MTLACFYEPLCFLANKIFFKVRHMLDFFTLIRYNNKKIHCFENRYCCNKIFFSYHKTGRFVPIL